MFLEESILIKDLLCTLNLHAGSVVLDCGSGNEMYRCLGQPSIDYYVFLPLRKLGVRIIHIDRVKDQGIDVVCDLENPDAQIETIEQGDVVLCTSLLEHVENRDLVTN